MLLDDRKIDTVGCKIYYSISKSLFDSMGFTEFKNASGAITSILLPQGWWKEKKSENNHQKRYHLFDINENDRGKFYIENKDGKCTCKFKFYTRFYIFIEGGGGNYNLVFYDRDISQNHKYRLELGLQSFKSAQERMVVETNTLLKCLPFADNPKEYWGIPVSIKTFFKSSASHWVKVMK